jgi:hypothetical protein
MHDAFAAAVGDPLLDRLKHLGRNAVGIAVGLDGDEPAVSAVEDEVRAEVGEAARQLEGGDTVGDVDPQRGQRRASTISAGVCDSSITRAARSWTRMRWFRAARRMSSNAVSGSTE